MRDAEVQGHLRTTAPGSRRQRLLHADAETLLHFFTLPTIPCSLPAFRTEDCRVLARLLKTSSPGDPIDISNVLKTYNRERLEDARAACLLSERGMGGQRSVRLAFMAQLLLLVFLNKTLGRFAPKVRSVSRTCTTRDTTHYTYHSFGPGSLASLIPRT